MDAQVRLRGGTPKDCRPAAEIWVAAAGARRAALGLAPGDRVEDFEPELSARMVNPASRLVLAEDGMVAVGMAMVVPARTDEGAGRELVPGLMHLACVAVDPTSWRRGIARQLVGATLGIARSEGFDRVQLWVVESNLAARALYAAAGFAPTGRTKPDEHGETIELWLAQVD